MDWNEPVLVERKYRKGPDQIAITVRLGFPRSTERPNEWACSFQFLGLGDGRIQVARGADGLQALTIAVSAIRQTLDDAGDDATSNEIPYEIVFPKFVPFAHGLDYHKRLCKLLDDEIERIEKELAAKRIARKRGSSDNIE